MVLYIFMDVSLDIGQETKAFNSDKMYIIKLFFIAIYLTKWRIISINIIQRTFPIMFWI